MYENLIIEDNTIYEMDEECVRKKELETKETGKQGNGDRQKQMAKD